MSNERPIAFDEMSGWDGHCRRPYDQVKALLANTTVDHLKLKSQEAELLFRRIGVTFAVYSEGGDPERLIPFDILPRVLDREEWSILERGLVQRTRALNMFLWDAYHGKEIMRAGKIPEKLITGNKLYVKEMIGFDLPQRTYTHIAGIDIVRTGPSEFYVLEDNVRTPSGVSYMIENREVMMRLFPDLFSGLNVAPVSHYPDELLDTLASVAPPACKSDPTVVLLTPGSYNSAYYEHSFLADEMGIELVEAPDLMVDNNCVYMRTTEGLKRVDVIYRRVDDDFLDPKVYRKDSALGVPGLVSSYLAGNVTIANAIGTGIADDKSVYRFVPEMVRFYLGEEPVLKNVPTYDCSHPEDLTYVLEHLEELVVKMVHGSGGYGMLVGPTASAGMRREFSAMLKEKADNYIAQPTLSLSTCPTFVGSGVAPRHIDLRPYVLVGNEIRIVPGGLTRVALAEGSLVVNSSQGGGTKDTWVLNTRASQRQSQSQR